MPVFGGNLPAAAAKPPKSGRGHPGGWHPAQPIYLFIHLSGRGGSRNGYRLASIRASGGRVRIAPNSSAAPASANSGR